MTVDPDEVEQRLDAKFRRESAGLRGVTAFHILEEGHAGLTFAFTVASADGRAAGSDYVLKLAPPGVVRRGNTDVYRQAPLLRALKAADVRVPDVPFASPDEDELGTPYIVMERLPGRTFIPWIPHESFDRSAPTLDAVWRQSAELLAGVHAFDWRTHLAGWEAERPLAAEVGYWTPLFAKAESSATRARGERLAARLAETMPADHRVGLAHGDYQPGNILFDDGQATGIIDWELSSIGAQGLDLGWLAMMVDPLCWPDGWRPVGTLDADELTEAYADALGEAPADRDWFEALACCRLGAITCLNLRLHRTGRRVDDVWERFGGGCDTMLERGLELVAKADTRNVH